MTANYNDEDTGVAQTPDEPWIKYYSQHDQVYWGKEKAIELAKERLAELQSSTGSANND